MKLSLLKESRAFTLIELLAVIAIVGVLTAALLPQVGNALDRAKAAKTMAVYDSMRLACISHYSDTGVYAYELPAVGWYTDVSQHQLTMSQSYSGWEGPYLEPFSYGINPTNGWIGIAQRLDQWYAAGFDLFMDGTPDKNGPGNFLHLELFPSRIAKLVNDRMDGTTGAGIGDWTTTGKVKWRPEWGGAIQIYITGG